MAGVWMILASAVVGVVALAPARRTMGELGYHSATLPVGLAGWMVTALVHAGLGLAWTPVTVVPSLAAYAAAIALAVRARGERTAWTPSARQTVTTLVYAATAAVLAWLTIRANTMSVSPDAWKHYEPLGMWLYEAGRLPNALITDRALLPALTAANRFFGGDWTTALYTVAAVNTLAFVGYGVLNASECIRSRPLRGTVAVGSMLLLGTTAPFIWHSIFAHSHMLSAMWLLLACVGVERARARQDGAVAWLVIAGISAAAFSLARPDGLAYVFAIHALVWLTWVRGLITQRQAIAYALTALAGALSYTAIALSTPTFVGAGAEGKVSSSLLIAMLAVTLVGAAAMGALGAWSRSRAWLSTHGRRAVVVMSVTAIAAGLVVRPGSVVLTLENFFVNVFLDGGGWNLLGFWILGALLFALVVRTLLEPWLRDLGWFIWVLSAAAVIVHGFTHPGQVGWYDSLNRVAFHMVPLVFWLYGGVVAALIASLTEEDGLSAAGRGHTESTPGTPSPLPNRTLADVIGFKNDVSSGRIAETIVHGSIAYLVFDALAHYRLDIRFFGAVGLTAVVLLAAVMGAYALHRKAREQVIARPTVMHALLVAFVFWVAFSALRVGNVPDLSFAKNLILFGVIVSVFTRARDVERVYFVGFVGGIVQVVLGVAQLALRGMPSDGLTGFLPNHVEYGFYLTLCLSCTLPLIVTDRSRRWFYTAGGAAMALLVVLSQARGALIVLLLIVLAWTVVVVRNRLLAAATVTLAATAAGVFTFAFPRLASLTKMIASLHDPAVLNRMLSGRLALYAAALRMIRENPVLGVGYARYAELWASYAPASLFLSEGFSERMFVTHSTFLQIAAETGLVGFVLYTGIILGAFVSAIRGLRHSQAGGFVTNGRALAGGVLMLLVAFAVHGAIDNSGWHERMFYVTLGLAVAVGRLATREADDVPPLKESTE